jgi:hypothetical protein
VRASLLAAAAFALAGTAYGSPTPVERTVPGTSLHIALPAGWRLIDHATALALTRRVGALNPQMAAIVSTLAQTGSSIRLVALDPSSRRGFATNANVVVERSPAASVADAVALELSVVRQVLHPIDLRQSTMQAAGRPAITVTYEARFNEPSGPTLVAQQQVYLVSSGKLYVLTLTTLPSQRASYAATFARIVGSLTFAQ